MRGWPIAAAAGAAVLFGGWTGAQALGKPVPARAAATCSDYDNQAQAQRAADTRDADGDGVYCESLPCPCAGPGSSKPKPRPRPKPSCSRTRGVAVLTFSAARYPNIREHYLEAVGEGWPRVLYVNRSGASKRRSKLMSKSGLPARSGYDRDEYPPAVGRGRGSRGLKRGANPTGWMAHLAYVPRSENRSHGARLGNLLRRYCDGQRFRYRFS